jgi:hypothetical protein
MMENESPSFSSLYSPVNVDKPSCIDRASNVGEIDAQPLLRRIMMTDEEYQTPDQVLKIKYFFVEFWYQL